MIVMSSPSVGFNGVHILMLLVSGLLGFVSVKYLEQPI